jgi:hypothetical protein
MKICSKCRFEKPLDEFGNRSDTKDGKKTQCRECCNLTNSNWRKKSDKARETQRRWQKENREKVREYEARYWEKNPEKLKEKLSRNGKLYRQRYPERVAERDKRWRENNPEARKVIEKRFRSSHPNKSRDDARRRKALLKGVTSEKFTEQDIFNRWGTDCYLCNKPVDLDAPRQVGIPGWEVGLHLDHVIPLKENGPDIVENVKPTHGLCNLKKN